MRRKSIKKVVIPRGCDPATVLGLEEEAPDDRPYTEEEVQIVFEEDGDDADEDADVDEEEGRDDA